MGGGGGGGNGGNDSVRDGGGGCLPMLMAVTETSNCHEWECQPYPHPHSSHPIIRSCTCASSTFIYYKIIYINLNTSILHKSSSVLFF